MVVLNLDGERYQKQKTHLSLCSKQIATQYKAQVHRGGWTTHSACSLITKNIGNFIIAPHVGLQTDSTPNFLMHTNAHT